MSQPHNAAKSSLDQRPGLLFTELDYALQVGNFVAAGRAAAQLEALGWYVSRPERREPDRPVPAEASTCELDDYGGGDFDADGTTRSLSEERPLSLAEVSGLVGIPADDLDDAIELGRFPLPDGFVSGRPYWDRATIGWWVKRGDAL